MGTKEVSYLKWCISWLIADQGWIDPYYWKRSKKLPCLELQSVVGKQNKKVFVITVIYIKDDQKRLL